MPSRGPDLSLIGRGLGNSARSSRVRRFSLCIPIPFALQMVSPADLPRGMTSLARAAVTVRPSYEGATIKQLFPGSAQPLLAIRPSVFGND
jgi:hypothetical protein